MKYFKPKEFSNFGNIFSTSLAPSKNKKNSEKKSTKNKHKKQNTKSSTMAEQFKLLKKIGTDNDPQNNIYKKPKFEKNKSSKTRVSESSSQSNWQQITNDSSNKELKKALTFKLETEALQNTNFSKNTKLSKEKDIYFPEQPNLSHYDTQRIIENINFDNQYDTNTKRNEHSKNIINIRKSFKSDEETGFMQKKKNVFEVDSD